PAPVDRPGPVPAPGPGRGPATKFSAGTTSAGTTSAGKDQCRQRSAWRRLARAAAGHRRGGRRGVLADPLVLPRRVVLLVVALRPVDRGELAADLLPVPFTAAGNLVHRDVHLPPRPGPADPARRGRVPEREPLGGQVLGLAHVDHCVPARPGV